MKHRTFNEQGVTLIELIIAMVLIAIVVTSLFAALATASTASKSHRDVVVADRVLRDYAEEAKTAARGCTAGATFTVVAPAPLPSGYTVNALASQNCPAVTAVSTLTISATFNGITKSLQVKVRTP